jgi:hypothetical protein
MVSGRFRQRSEALRDKRSRSGRITREAKHSAGHSAPAFTRPLEVHVSNGAVDAPPYEATSTWNDAETDSRTLAIIERIPRRSGRTESADP